MDILPGHNSSCDRAAPTYATYRDEFVCLTFWNECDIYSLDIGSRQIQFAPRF